ncbi:U-box domain-containing protein 33 [Dichanthelium oligosanthes]|uniref:RING-type E3 ubiquitin transferase n=1 Tax=Dichanthelium oligosanthes TaxID=888268 RepID=A0A1E5UK73_9POAL|nr:U-box domain-containing protein 33 [Dichanthelium oligosanthes]
METAARGQTPESAQHSFRTAASRFASNAREQAESPPVEDKIFVAVPQDLKHGKNTLIWALQNLVRHSPRSRIVIAHVHSPAQIIPSNRLLGAKVHHSKMEQEELSEYRQHETEKMNKKLHEYVMICTRLKVNCDKETIEKDDIATGIMELIASHGITKIVVGAAADKNYSKEASEEISAVPASPAATNTAPLPAFSISNQMRSLMIHQLDNEASSSNVSTMNTGRSRTDKFSPSQRTFGTLLQQCAHGEADFDGKTRRLRSLENFSMDSSRSQNSRRSSSPNEGAASISVRAVVDDDDTSEVGSSMHLSTDDSYDHISPTALDLDKLKETLTEIEFLKKEVHEECNKRRNAERELHSALRKTKELEKSYMLRQQKTLEEMHARQKQEIDVMRRQQEEAYGALYNANEQKVTLEQRIREIELYVKDNEDKLATNKHQLEVLQADYDRIQNERDAAVREAAELREKNQQGALVPSEALNTNFSLTELQQATQDFDPMLKIGEGGFGNVYKGFLRNTTVAIKLLHPQSMQGQSEFHQEASNCSLTIFSVARKCDLHGYDIFQLFPCRLLFSAHLEDCIARKNNTPPLTWQIRTRIIGEMCSALIFLHSNKPHPVVHGDLKPDNILLDANYSSKLGDFGICRLLIQTNTCSTTLYRTTNPKGTLSYMDPEFLTTGELTPRSDVYSFGIIILRLLTGKQPQRIAEIVEQAIEQGSLHSIIDNSAGSWPFIQANQLAHIGLRCAELSRRHRPDLTVDVWKVVEPLMKAASMTARPLSGTNLSDDACIPSYFICPILQNKRKEKKDQFNILKVELLRQLICNVFSTRSATKFDKRKQNTIEYTELMHCIMM